MATTKKKAVKKKVVKKKAVNKKAVRKTAAKKAATKKTKTSPSNAKIKVTHDQHYKMICEAAYYISLDRNRETVNPTGDWLQAEAAINRICIIAE